MYIKEQDKNPENCHGRMLVYIVSLSLSLYIGSNLYIDIVRFVVKFIYSGI